jgi:hypothetical protein
LLATTAFASASAGAVALIGTASSASVAIPLVVALCVVGGIFSVGLSLDRFPAQALAMTIGLPVPFALYFAGLTQVAGMGAGVAALLLAIAVVPAWLAVRPLVGRTHFVRPGARAAA